MCVRGEELSVGTKLGFTKWGLTKVNLSSFNVLICQGQLVVNIHRMGATSSCFNIIFSQITASVVEANGMVHSAEGETRELAVASLERAVAHLQRVEKGAARLDNGQIDQLDLK